MDNSSMRIAIRKRLGLLPFDSLSKQFCFCRRTTAFDTDPDHFHSCDKTKRTCLTQRHNNLVQVLIDLAHTAGFTCIKEPNSHIRPDGIAQQSPLSIAYNQHADILMLRHDQKLYIDVTVTRPTNESNVRSGHTQFRPLRAARVPSHTSTPSTETSPAPMAISCSHLHWRATAALDLKPLDS